MNCRNLKINIEKSYLIYDVATLRPLIKQGNLITLREKNNTSCNMKNLTIILMLLITAFSSCNKKDFTKGTPKCVEEKIKSFNITSTCADACVKEYMFQGASVYTFEPGTCGRDMTTEVIDRDCKKLGYLGGSWGTQKLMEKDSPKLFLLKRSGRNKNQSKQEP